MTWLWIGLGALVLVVLVFPYLLHLHIVRKYLPYLYRIFQEKPLFNIPRGQPITDAEEVTLASTNDVTLHGCYLKAKGARKGVVLFGLEYGSNCWSCLTYCDFLRSSGYDIFAFETRGHGTSKAQEGYEPLQWVTAFEVQDFQAALAYLKQRKDADARGVGFFGLSKGGSAGLFMAADDPYVRCCVVDGIFSIYTTMVPYMMKWIAIFTSRRIIINWLPAWYFHYLAFMSLRNLEKQRHCVFPSLEGVIRRIAPRPLFMIHGSADNYIKPEMAQKLFSKAREPKEIWLVEGAKHNQAIHLAEAQYKKRVLDFFDEHLAQDKKTGPSKARAMPRSPLARG